MNNIATNRQYCHVVSTKISSKSEKTQLNGICKMNTTGFEFFPRAVQFPGEMCDGISAVYECKTGYKKCRAHRCQGYSEGSRCSNSFDCNFNFYCDSLSQQCKPIIENGQPCWSSDQCSKNSLCKYSVVTNSQGVCT